MADKILKLKEVVKVQNYVPEVVHKDSDYLHEVIVYEDVYNEELGFTTKVAKVQIVDDRKKFEGMKSSDFSLYNMLAAGATDLLKPVQFSGSSVGSVDGLEKSAQSIVSAAEKEAASSVESAE